MKRGKPGQRVAIVYDRVNKWGGAERVLLALNELYPNAVLFTSVYDQKNASWASVFRRIETSFLQRIPSAKNNHEFLAPLMPLAFESFNFRDFDLVISVTSEAAKGIITPPNVTHICYCLTPTRYLWSGRKEYFHSKLLKNVGKPFVDYLTWWDKVASSRPDKMIGISHEVGNRIKKYYGRESDLIFPPVETKLFSSIKRKKKDYFLLVSRLVKYKKVDIAIRAFNKLPETLVIVGTGREEKKLRKIAGKNIYFLGSVSDQDLAGLYSGAKALIFPQKEDFGIVAVEAQAAGVPVIAYSRGGSADTIIPGSTGIYFHPQTPKSLQKAVEVFDTLKFDSSRIKEHSKKFSKEHFLEEFDKMVSRI